MPDFIKVPSERVEQLRTLSKNRDISIADLIGEFVNDQIAKGHLTNDIPGIAVTRKGELVTVDLGEFSRVMTPELAQAYATCLKWLATPRSAGMVTAARDAAEMVSGAHLVGIARRGTSIRLTGENGGERTLAPSVARDLANVVAKVAA